MIYVIRKLILVLAGMSVLLANPAVADIVGGEEVQEPDPIRSSTIGLFTPSPGGQSGALCTASIIGKGMALTAAHCISPGGAKPILLFGRDIHAAETVKRAATAVSVNPLWGKRQGKGMDEGDIALVKFAGPLPKGYRQVRLNRSDANLVKGRAAVLAGYGISNAQTHSGAGILRKTSISIDNPRSGKSEMVLNQSHGRGACHGDSGGPAFVNVGGKNVLAGVTNRSYPAHAPDDCGHQVVYTKVNAYRSWIAKEEKSMRGSASAPAVLAMRSAGRHSKTRVLAHRSRAGRAVAQRAIRPARAERHTHHSRRQRNR